MNNVWRALLSILVLGSLPALLGRVTPIRVRPAAEIFTSEFNALDACGKLDGVLSVLWVNESRRATLGAWCSQADPRSLLLIDCALPAVQMLVALAYLFAEILAELINAVPESHDKGLWNLLCSVSVTLAFISWNEEDNKVLRQLRAIEEARCHRSATRFIELRNGDARIPVSV